MSVDRSYLQSKAAREYQDRGMKKWMGFFLSEHSTAMTQNYGVEEPSRKQDSQTIILLMSQAYAQRLHVMISYKKDKKVNHIEGVIDSYDLNQVGIKGDQDYQFIPFDDLFEIELVHV